jgi:hypothetical protein
MKRAHEIAREMDGSVPYHERLSEATDLAWKEVKEHHARAIKEMQLGSVELGPNVRAFRHPTYWTVMVQWKEFAVHSDHFEDLSAAREYARGTAAYLARCLPFILDLVDKIGEDRMGLIVKILGIYRLTNGKQ